MARNRIKKILFYYINFYMHTMKVRLKAVVDLGGTLVYGFFRKTWEILCKRPKKGDGGVHSCDRRNLAATTRELSSPLKNTVSFQSTNFIQHCSGESGISQIGSGGAPFFPDNCMERKKMAKRWILYTCF